jgi:hypothetical protein
MWWFLIVIIFVLVWVRLFGDSLVAVIREFVSYRKVQSLTRKTIEDMNKASKPENRLW